MGTSTETAGGPGFSRLRRPRRIPAFRRLVREKALSADHLILPLFVSEVDEAEAEIESMPGAYGWQLARVAQAVAEAEEAGVGGALLFGIPVREGADLLMVKPGLTYMDIVRRARVTYPNFPLAAYNVSGEYSMVKAAAERGWLDERSIVLETLLPFRQAGADLVITYHAPDAARRLAEDASPAPGAVQ